MNKKLTTLMFTTLLATSNIAFSTGIPTFDAGNFAQTSISALENIQQTLNLLQNTLKIDPDKVNWNDVENTINELQRISNTLEYYKNAVGSLDKMLDKNNNVDYYEALCLNNNSGSSNCRWDKMTYESNKKNTEFQKIANDSLFKGLEQQQATINQDAKLLSKIQGDSQTAKGRLQAIQFANQFASHQASQLLQIRQMMATQQAVFGAQIQAQTDKEAKQAVADKEFFDSDNLNYQPEKAQKEAFKF